MSAGPSTIEQVPSSNASGRDVVAVFHTSFHPTQGNTVDWCLKAPGWEDLQHEHLSLEFSALPSGLHQVDEDVVYFTTSASKTSSSPCLLHAISLFRRRRTPNPTYRGFLLSALGVLVVPSHPDASKNGVQKARPWLHLSALREIAERCYSQPGSDPSATPATAPLVDLESSTETEAEEWYAPARTFLAERGVVGLSLQDFLSFPLDRPVQLSDSEQVELLDLRHELASADKEHIPALQLPSLVSLLGPSSVTLFKHLLARKRVMIYTNVPVGPACTMCYAIVDMVRGMQTEAMNDDEDVKMPPQHKGPVRVLGMLTLNDLVQDQKRGLVENKIDQGYGWVACTTDALFLEKPQYYDLLIDLTALPAYSSLSSSSSTSGFYASRTEPVSSPQRIPGEGAKKPSNFASNRPRPTFYVSKAIPLGPGTRPFYKLSQIRWAWSDVRLWNDIDRILNSTPAYEPSAARPSSSLPTPTSSTLQPLTSTASSASSVSQPNSTSKPTKQKSKSKSRERRNRGTSSPSSTSRSQSPEASGSRTTSSIPTSLTDAWKLYEDMCIVCANAWMGTLCARAGGPSSPSTAVTCMHPSQPCTVPPPPIQPPSVVPPAVEPSGRSSAVHLEGEDDILLRTVRGATELSPGVLAKMRDPSSSSYASGQTVVGDDTLQNKPIDTVVLGSAAVACETLSTEHATALNLLFTFDRYAAWQVGVLQTYVKSLIGNVAADESSKLRLTLSPRDLVLLDLNPLSSGDVRYLEALLKEYAGHVVVKVEGEEAGSAVMGLEETQVEGSQEAVISRTKRKKARELNVDLVVRRGWKDLIGVVFGFV